MKLKKIIKKSRKRIKKSLKKTVSKPVYKLWEGFDDFFGDLFNFVYKKKLKKLKKIDFYGSVVAVRPAYIFAERVENLLKIIFGFSILMTAIIASAWGFTRVAELISFLINTVAGRIILIIIGLSFLTVGLWMFLNLKLEE